MYHVRTTTALTNTSRHFNDVNEAVAYCHRLVKAYRSFDVYKGDALIATGDRDGIYPIRKTKKQIRGSVGYAQMMEERRI